MTTIQTYLYSQIVRVQILDSGSFVKRDRTVYARPVTVYQGIDNPISIQVRNQEQRMVDMTTNLMQVDIQNPNLQLTEYSLGIEWTDRVRGYGQFVVTKEILDTLDQRHYTLTFRVIDQDSNRQRPAFVDDNYGVPLNMIVKPAYYADMLVQEGETSSNDFNKIDGGTI